MKTRDGIAELNIVLNGSGRSIQEYENGGNVFVEGRKGSAFAIEYRNHTAKNVLVIPSVDGKSTFDGQPATPDSKGFVVKPWSSVKIKGWTLNTGEVAQFEFSDKESSYAVVMEGTSARTGVIGVLVYEEKVVVQPKPVEIHHHYHPPIKRQDPDPVPWPGAKPLPPIWMGSSKASYTADQVKALSATRSMMASSNANLSSDVVATNVDQPEGAFDMGTGFGAKTEQATREVKFQRGGIIAQMVLYYDSRKNLEKRGIQVTRREDRYVNDLPQAFYGTGCTPPPGWTG